MVSGIAPSPRTGTGLLLLGFEADRLQHDLPVHMIYGGNRADFGVRMALHDPLGNLRAACQHLQRRRRLAALLNDEAFLRTPRLLLLHPQEIGFGWVMSVLGRRAAAGLATELFVLDASFFCVRSYNHIPGECGPCLRCHGGQFDQALRMGCRPFPKSDPQAYAFVRALRDHAREGRVHFWTQTQSHAELVRQHMGDGAVVRWAGLWTGEFDRLLQRPAPAAALADVVFHGAAVPAKGLLWSVSLAAAMPSRKFLFPCRPPRGLSRPPNAVFQAMTWGTGLAQQVAAAPWTLVPSLWSAPIEGALVKSIALAPAVAVVDGPFVFGREIPDDVVMKLPADTAQAAALLEQRWNWRPTARDHWVDRFVSTHRGLLGRLVRAEALA